MTAGTVVPISKLKRVAFIGNSLPRRCGIATFTTDLQQAVAGSRPHLDTSIVAMTDRGQAYAYPETVRIEIKDDRPEDYLAAAEKLNRSHVDVVSLQHEFGIFGGAAGINILPLLSRLNMPVVTTLHTVLAEPTPVQRRVFERIIEASSRLVVMAEKGRATLEGIYGVPAHKIEVIAHGIPDAPFESSEPAKSRMGYGGRPVMLTFGLLSPNKGIEVVIDAMPMILEGSPNAVYVVLGATHPHLVRDQGEAYRESLVARVAALGIEDHVVFLDQFVDLETLLRHISMCDVYVTPYLDKAQMTSGTLAYSFGLGRAIVSTPYWHACELLADGGGILVPFHDHQAIGRAVSGLLTDDARRQALSQTAYERSRSMTWANTAERYIEVFESVRPDQPVTVLPRRVPSARGRPPGLPPEIRIGHLAAMCDNTGLYQHAVHSVPDRAHGYCVDDNARGLLLASTLEDSADPGLPDLMTSRFAAFVQHAWNPDTRRFRNFMSFDRRWLEDKGSEDSHGRTLWALGECARRDASPSRRRWAAALFAEALPSVEDFRSPRAFAATLLGLDAYCWAHPDDETAERIRLLLADRLMASLASAETSEWVWFEDGLSYDNARLPQALIVTGLATGLTPYVQAGLRSLRWLMGHQTSPSGVFRPVGSRTFGALRKPPEAFDQQPLEATAVISACLSAWRAEDDPQWKLEAERAFAWFLGDNDLQIPLADVHSGSCRDGLHPNRANENRGGESVVCYLLGLCEIRQMARARGDRPTRIVAQKVLNFLNPALLPTPML